MLKIFLNDQGIGVNSCSIVDNNGFTGNAWPSTILVVPPSSCVYIYRERQQLDPSWKLKSHERNMQWHHCWFLQLLIFLDAASFCFHMVRKWNHTEK